MTETSVDSIRSVCQSGTVSETVVDALAEAKGVDPLELDPLYTVVDPDALDGLFQPTIGSPPDSIVIQFSMDGYRVTVQGDGEVTVTALEKSNEC